MKPTIYEEGRTEEVTRDGVTVVRTLRVEPYALRQNVLFALLGGVRLLGGLLVRFPPARDPWYPYCLCESASITGAGVFGHAQPNGYTMLAQANIYDAGARIVATYKTFSSDLTPTSGGSGDGGEPGGQNPTAQQEIDICTENLDFNAQQLTLPNDQWKWQGATALLANTNTGATKTIPKIDYTLVRHLVVRIPRVAIRDMIGRVNQGTFRAGGVDWPPECLRFDGAATTRKVTNQGFQFAEITYKFAIMPVVDTIAAGLLAYVGWNRLFRPDTGLWEYPVLVSDPTRKLYLLDQAAPSQTINDPSAGTILVRGFDLLFHPGAI